MKKNKRTMQTNNKSHTLLYPILPLSLSIKKPKNYKYPKKIRTVGDEFRRTRLDRELTQHQVAEHLNVNRNFVYELELGKRETTIFALHKTYLFLGHIPKTLKIDKNTLQGKLFAYRVKNGFTYQILADKTGLDKSTLARFERNEKCKKETNTKIYNFLKEY